MVSLVKPALYAALDSAQSVLIAGAGGGSECMRAVGDITIAGG
jgi:hypothetical protein